MKLQDQKHEIVDFQIGQTVRYCRPGSNTVRAKIVNVSDQTRDGLLWLEWESENRKHQEVANPGDCVIETE